MQGVRSVGLSLALACACADEPPPEPVASIQPVEPTAVDEPTPSAATVPEQIEIPGELAAQPAETQGYARGSGAGFGGKGKRVPQVRQAKAQIDGALERDEVRKVVREHINEVRSCFNLGIMGKRAALVERVAIEFEIGPDGKVRYAKVVEDTGKDPQVGACVAKAIERWRFPRPSDGEPVTVIYPFNLYPG